MLIAWMMAATGSGQDVIANIQQGTNMALALSPSGETIVVDLVGQLWEIPVTGGAAVPITAVGEPSRNPRFSPGGDRIVYQKERGGQWDLWLLDTSNGIERQLTGPPFDEREPDFSADGQAVVYASDRRAANRAMHPFRRSPTVAISCM
jgi:dipeptidyl aminopeptidase/acylaminoacyl peptidase